MTNRGEFFFTTTTSQRTDVKRVSSKQGKVYPRETRYGGSKLSIHRDRSTRCRLACASFSILLSSTIKPQHATRRLPPPTHHHPSIVPRRMMIGRRKWAGGLLKLCVACFLLAYAEAQVESPDASSSANKLPCICTPIGSIPDPVVYRTKE